MQVKPLTTIFYYPHHFIKNDHFNSKKGRKDLIVEEECSYHEKTFIHIHVHTENGNIIKMYTFII